jgi:hypothetical protein
MMCPRMLRDIMRIWISDMTGRTTILLMRGASKRETGMISRVGIYMDGFD